MKNSIQLLKAIGQIPDKYIEDAHCSQFKIPHKRIFLLVAIVSILLLAGCAALAGNWYVQYFSSKNHSPLSENQVQYLESHSEEFGDKQTYNGYTIEFDSALSEGNWAYVTFKITAPENVDFTSVLEENSQENIFLDDLTARFQENALPSDLSYDVVEDNDGQKNTLHIVLKINTVIISDAEPNDEKLPCTISFSGITHRGYDEEVQKDLLREKYPDNWQTVTDYILDGEEGGKVGLIHPTTVLADGNWRFQVELSVKTGKASSLELIEQPVSTIALAMRQGKNEYEEVWRIEPIIVHSVVMDSLGLTVRFEPSEPLPDTDSMFLSPAEYEGSPMLALVGNPEISSDQELYLMMKDGTKITLFQGKSARDEAVFSADSPIIQEDIKYLHFPDGKKIEIGKK